jgi:hypothetical protein
MIKKISILSLFTILLVVTGCEKCSKPNMTDPFVNAEYSEDVPTTRGRDLDGPTNADANAGAASDGDITDPNEGEDFDGIVDPNEDEDFDSDGK